MSTKAEAFDATKRLALSLLESFKVLWHDHGDGFRDLNGNDAGFHLDRIGAVCAAYRECASDFDAALKCLATVSRAPVQTMAVRALSSTEFVIRLALDFVEFFAATTGM